MRKRRFLHHREAKISGGHASLQEFFACESFFLEGREVFYGPAPKQCTEDIVEIERGDGYNSLNIYTKEQCERDQLKLKTKIYHNQFADTIIYPQGDTEVKSYPLTPSKNKVSNSSLPLDSRGSFENIDPKLKNYLEQLGISEDISHFDFPKKAHFRNVITNGGKNLDVPSVAKSLSQEVFQVDHTTQTVQNQNLQEWGKSEFWKKDSEITFEAGRDWQKKKVEILGANIVRVGEYLKLAVEETKNSSNPDFLAIIHKIQNSSDFQKNIRDIDIELTKKNSSLTKKEKLVLKRLKSIYESYIEMTILSQNKEILQPDSGPWLQKIKNLESQVKEINKKIENLKIIINPTDNQKKELIQYQKLLELTNKELSLRKSYQSNYNDIHTGEKLYKKFFTPKNPATGEEEKLKNPADSIEELGKYYEWAEKELFSDGIPYPTPKVRALLMSQVFSGKISVKGLRQGLQKLAGAPDRTKNYQLDTLKDKKGVMDFYGEIGSVLNTKPNSQERRKQANYFLRKYQNTFDAKTFSEIFKYIYSWGNTLSEKTPLELKKNRESTERGLEQQYGVPPASMWVQWKKISTQPLQSGELDNAQRKKTIGSVFPLETWFDEQGNINIPENNFSEFQRALKLSIPVSVMKEFNTSGQFKSETIEKIYNQNWGKNDPDVKVFLEQYNHYFQQRKTTESHIGFENTQNAVKQMEDEIKKSQEGGKITDFLSNAMDEALDGNPAYMTVFAIAGFMFFKNEKMRNLMLTIGGAAALNEVVLNETGVDWLQNTINLFTDKSEVQKANPASWAVLSMEKNKELDDKNIETDEFERAAVFLASADFSGPADSPNILAWYDRTESLLNNPDKDSTESPYLNDCMPLNLKKHLLRIKAGETDTKEENAQIAFKFLQKYFKHIDQKYSTNRGPMQASIGNGKKILIDKYGRGKSDHSPFTLGEIFAQETTQEEQRYIEADRSRISEIFEENSDKAWNWLSANFDATTGGYENILKTFEEAKNWAKEKSYQIKITVQNELEFWDGTKKVFSIVKNKAEEWVLQPVTGFVGLGAAGKGYKTFEDAWEGVKKGVNTVHAKALNLKNKWIAYLSDIPTEKLKDSVTLSPQGIVQAVSDLGLTDEITETYGFDRIEYTSLAIQEVAKTNSFKTAIKKIAKHRMQIDLKAKGKSDVINDADIKITNEDVLAYFLSGAYGIGKTVQTGINVSRAGAEQISRGVSGFFGELNSSAEGYFDSFGGDHALEIFLQDHIDGHSNFRKLAKEISVKSLNAPVSSTSRIIWTAENLQNFALNSLHKNLINISKKPGSSPQKDIETVKKILISDFQRFFALESNRELFYSSASQLTGFIKPQIGPSKDQAEEGFKKLINKFLKDIDSNWELK